MSEDATAKELELLLRDALKESSGDKRGSAPILQLHTVPIEMRPQPVAPKPADDDLPRDSTPGLAERIEGEGLKPAGAKSAKYVKKSEEEPAPSGASTKEAAPVSVAPASAKDAGAKDAGAKDAGAKPATAAAPRKSGRSTFALVALGAVAILAAGGAWVAHKHGLLPMATAASTPATTAPAAAKPAPESSEGAVGIAVASRPATAATGATSATPSAKAEEPKEAPPVAGRAPEPPAKPEPPKAEAKASPPPAVAKASPPPAVAKASPPPAKPAPVAKAEPAKAPEAKPEPPKPAAPQGGSVDAILQQQLKGAIP